MRRVFIILSILFVARAAFTQAPPYPHPDGSNCIAGEYARGVDENGDAQDCSVDVGAGSNDDVFIDGVAAADPDFRSEGDLDAIRCTGPAAPDPDCVAIEDVLYRYQPGSIDNADVNASAAIAGSKIVPTFPDTVLMEGILDIGTIETFPSLDATPNVESGSYWKTSISSFTITDFDGAGIVSGQLLTVFSASTTTFDCTSTGLKCGTTDLLTGNGDLTVWLYDGTDWQLIAFKDQTQDMGANVNSLGLILTSANNDITYTDTSAIVFAATQGTAETVTLDLETNNTAFWRGTANVWDLLVNFTNTGYMQFKMRWINSGVSSATLPNSYTKQQWSCFTNTGVVSLTLAGASAGFYGCFVDCEGDEELKIKAASGDVIELNGVSIGAGDFLCNDPTGADIQVKNDYVCLIAKDSSTWMLVDQDTREGWGDCGP